MTTTLSQRIRVIGLLTAALVLSGCLGADRSYDETELEALNASSEVVLQVGNDAIEDDFEERAAETALVSDINETLEERLTHQYVYPMEGYLDNRTTKVFGQYIAPDSGDRFSGYHTGDDVEVADVEKEYPVVAITNGVIRAVDTIDGYGGVVILEFTYEDIEYHALYGHIDITSAGVTEGQAVSVGQELGLLGDHESEETDGERKHLHFGIYPYFGTTEYAGYVPEERNTTRWENPVSFLQTKHVTDPFADDTLTAEEVSDVLENVLTQ